MDEATLLEPGAIDIAFVERSGLKVVAAQRGRVRCLMPFRGNENHIGTMYAGALFTLAELPGGLLYLTSFDTTKFFPIAKEVNIRFRRPAVGDVTVEVELSEESIAAITAETVAQGKADYVLEGELKAEDGTVVAISRGVYQLRAIG
ncbi:MAG: PaaI family thioesterase [Segniliparus sp.]|uniref:PaaI family thioesterase n=1 Tax=Segniliparus sp. TaxID=2804064 RepID=UPI003F364C5F